MKNHTDIPHLLFPNRQTPLSIMWIGKQRKMQKKKVMAVLCVRMRVSYGRLLVVHPWMPEQRQG